MGRQENIYGGAKFPYDLYLTFYPLSAPKVEKLQGVTFDWKEQDITNLKEDIGFIAQDVQKVLPELVRENKDGKLSVRHQGIIPVLLEAIKELSDKIKILENTENLKPTTLNDGNTTPDLEPWFITNISEQHMPKKLSII